MGATETVDLFLELINDDERERAVDLFAEHAIMGISTPGSDERTNLRGRDRVGGRVWTVREPFEVPCQRLLVVIRGE